MSKWGVVAAAAAVVSGCSQPDPPPSPAVYTLFDVQALYDQREGLGPAATKERLGTMDIGSDGSSLPRKLGAAFVVAHPVDEIRMEMEVFRKVEAVSPGHPLDERLLTQFESSLDVTAFSALAQRMALESERRREAR